jgi:chromosome segregation ATPase
LSLENLQKRRTEIESQIQQRQKEIQDLKMQVDNAEITIRQWTDTILIQRGQLIELDSLIREIQTPEEEPKDKRGKKDEKGDA